MNPNINTKFWTLIKVMRTLRLNKEENNAIVELLYNIVTSEREALEPKYNDLYDRILKTEVDQDGWKHWPAATKDEATK